MTELQSQTSSEQFANHHTVAVITVGNELIKEDVSTSNDRPVKEEKEKKEKKKEKDKK